MVGLREAIAGGVRRATCAVLDTADQGRDWLEDITSTIPGVGGAASVLDDVGDGLSGLVCPPEGGSGVVRPPGGGRNTGNCDLVPYLFEWQYTQESGTRTTQTIDALLGPIGDFIVEERANGNRNVLIECRGAQGLPPLPPGSTRRLLSNTSQPNPDPVLLSLTRKDGQPDDCPPPDAGEDGPPTVDDDITYDPPGGGPPITIPVTFIFGGPLLQINTDVVIPVNITGPTFDLDVNFNISDNSINFKFGGGNDDQSCCCLPEEEGEEDEEPDGEKRLLGVVVTTTIIPESPRITQVFNLTGPTLLIKDVGVVMFQVKVGENTPWLKPVQLQVSPQYVPVDESQYAVDYSVLTRPGVTATTIPIYASITPDIVMM